MKRFTYFLISFILTTAVFAQNVNVSDYNVPVSTAKILRLNGNFNWSQSSQDQATGDALTTVHSNNANLGLIFKTFYSSLPFAWFIDVDAQGGKNFSTWNHDISIIPKVQKYIWDSRDWFSFAKLDLRHVNTYKQINSNITLGAGYGRHINATALAKAVRIEEHLIKEGVISGYLPKETMIKIANIIEREEEYRGVYGATYETVWYEDIESEIRTSGKLTGANLGAIGILRMQQVLKSINERVNDRYYGWDASFGALFNISRFDKSNPGSPSVSISARYSHPVTWRSQVNASLNTYTPLDSLFFKNVTFNLNADYIYELSNRINIVTGYRMDIRKPNSTQDSWTDHVLTSSFIFYLENQINLAVNFSLRNLGNPTVAATNYLGKTDLASSISLQYNLF